MYKILILNKYKYCLQIEICTIITFFLYLSAQQSYSQYLIKNFSCKHKQIHKFCKNYIIFFLLEYILLSLFLNTKFNKSAQSVYIKLNQKTKIKKKSEVTSKKKSNKKNTFIIYLKKFQGKKFPFAASMSIFTTMTVVIVHRHVLM